MWRWLLVVFISLLLVQGIWPWLSRFGFGRLPGDIHFEWMGREFHLPITTTLILSGVCALIAKLL
ncbi:MAG: hypothetical protein RL307_400 [Pseudomonadota bacterium]|jgi:hypothetical protein